MSLTQDITTQSAILLEYASAKGAMITSAESCTGGLICGAITEIAGASTIFDRGFITYSNEAKIDMLDVSPQTLEEFGAVSEETAKEMAQGALKHSKATISVSVTGIAGPGGSLKKPEGRVCFALACSQSPTLSVTHDFGAMGRHQVRQQAVLTALKLLTNALAL